MIELSWTGQARDYWLELCSSLSGWTLSEMYHRRARLIWALSSKIQDLFSYNLNFKQDSRIHYILISSKIWEFKTKISMSSKIQESKKQNLNYKQDSRITNGLVLAAKESKIHRQNLNLHIGFVYSFEPVSPYKFCETLFK